MDGWAGVIVAIVGQAVTGVAVLLTIARKSGANTAILERVEQQVRLTNGKVQEHAVAIAKLETHVKECPAPHYSRLFPTSGPNGQGGE